MFFNSCMINFHIVSGRTILECFAITSFRIFKSRRIIFLIALGQMPPVLAEWKVGKVPVLRCWSDGRVQHAAVYSPRVQSDRCQGWYSFICLFVHSFIHSFVHSFICSFIHPFICSFIHLCIHSFIHTFIHLFIQLFIHSSIYSIHSFVHSFIHSLFHSFVHSFICSFVHSFVRSFIQKGSSLFYYFSQILCFLHKFIVKMWIIFIVIINNKINKKCSWVSSFLFNYWMFMGFLGWPVTDYSTIPFHWLARTRCA